MLLNKWNILPYRLLLSMAAFLPIGLFQPLAPPQPLTPTIGTAETVTASINAPEYTGCTAQQVPVVEANFEQEVIELVNAERATQGLPPLKRIAELDAAARYHAADMAQDNYFQHDSYDRVNNQLQLACKWSTRVGNFYPGWSHLGENIAGGYSTPADVMNGWMNSSGHRENILSPSFSEIGIGYGSGNNWAQDFGWRSDSYPVIINNDAGATDSQSVTLYVYGSWSEIRLRNDTESWSEWQPFNNILSWQLPNSAGLHAVSVELRSADKTASGMDAIQLNSTAPSLPVLGSLPSSLHFTYSRADGRFSPAQTVITPTNTGNQEALSWKVTVQSGPFSVSPSQGSTPGSFTVSPSGANKLTAGTYSGSLVLTITSPGNVTGAPHSIDLALDVSDKPLRQIYLPILWTNTTR